ncbi:YhbY family RNA-binding protein [Halocatena salina]|uniref:YhbY family RNA-binding protein n=1 Tax=Halocatena salina TaxID=2934340 RepID=A0A8U0A7P0_9EURY|nr:YhbY family RNA-binding protein [Halocatena salina]UPM43927.1 YhbY family RNA-binding protein [Halocatena salina]
MSDELRERAHEIDATVRVGKRGIDSVVDELRDQLTERTLVKVKFLRSSRGGTTTDDLAVELASKVDAELVETRGHTAVYH